MAPKTQNFTLYRGDTHLFKVRLTAESTPLDLSQTHFQMDIVAGDGSVVRPEIKVADNLVVLLFPAALTRSLTWHILLAEKRHKKQVENWLSVIGKKRRCRRV